MNIVLAIFIGGGLGSVARYGISELVKMIWKGQFPLGTLLANLLSCVIIGLLLGYFNNKINSQELRSLILIGFCGGFSTFSTFSKETLELFQNGNAAIAIINIIVSLVFCILILWFLSVKTT